MRKYILLASMFLVSLLSFSNNIDSVISKTVESSLETIPDSLNLTFNKVYEDVKSGLSALGSSLKVGSEHVYEILIKQQVTVSITNIILLIMGIILLIYTLKKLPTLGWTSDHYYNRDWENKGGYEAYKKTTFQLINVIVIILTIISLILIGVSLCSINETITGLTNPEYGALKEIMNFIK